METDRIQYVDHYKYKYVDRAPGTARRGGTPRRRIIIIMIIIIIIIIIIFIVIIIIIIIIISSSSTIQGRRTIHDQYKFILQAIRNGFLGGPQVPCEKDL